MPEGQYEHIRYEKKGRVALVTLNRGEESLIDPSKIRQCVLRKTPLAPDPANSLPA